MFFLISCSQTNFNSDPSGGGLREVFSNPTSRVPVDILFVLDSNKTPYSHTQSQLESFIDGLQGIDWRLAITTSEVGDGKGGEFISIPGQKSKILTPSGSAKSRFFQALDEARKKPRMKASSLRNFGPSVSEEGCSDCHLKTLRAAQLAIEKSQNENSALFRDRADVALVLTTARTDYSVPPQEIQDSFEKVWGKSKELTAYGIYLRPTVDARNNHRSYKSISDQNCGTRLNEGLPWGAFHLIAFSSYEDNLVLATEGKAISICKKTYENLLLEKRKPISSVTLNQAPQIDSISVTTSPSIEDLEFRVEEKTLYFDQGISAGTTVIVDYLAEVEDEPSLDE